jgi:glutamyl-tRNA synthetase
MGFDFIKKIFSSKKVVTRIAPSPTGMFHLGTARTALYNFLFAKKYNGKFIVRIEDTDKERSKIEFEKDILEGFSWLGINYDELFKQSERTEIYTNYLKQLIKTKKAYISKEESVQNPGTETEVVRLKNKGEIITFNDKIRGKIKFDTSELGNFVIARSMTEPLYHLAVVVDDYEMGVTHVIRGEDHISNTPRQILIQRALGISEPKYAHIPLILAPDRSKMSKRKGSTSITEYRKNGYIKEAIINYLAFIGWNPGTDKEIYSIDELIKDFSLEKVQKSGAIFDTNKLNWFNREHIRALPNKDKLQLFKDFLPEEIKKMPQYSEKRLNRISNEIIERVYTLKELNETALSGELDYFFDFPKIETKMSWKDDSVEITKRHLNFVIVKLNKLPEDEFTYETIKKILWSYAESVGKGSVLWPIRVALSGKEKSPDPFTLSSIFGKEETIKRLKDAQKQL